MKNSSAISKLALSHSPLSRGSKPPFVRAARLALMIGLNIVGAIARTETGAAPLPTWPMPLDARFERMSLKEAQQKYTQLVSQKPQTFHCDSLDAQRNITHDDVTTLNPKPLISIGYRSKSGPPSFRFESGDADSMMVTILSTDNGKTKITAVEYKIFSTNHFEPQAGVSAVMKPNASPARRWVFEIGAQCRPLS